MPSQIHLDYPDWSYAHRGEVGYFHGADRTGSAPSLGQKIKYFQWSLVKRTDCARRKSSVREIKINKWPAKPEENRKLTSKAATDCSPDVLGNLVLEF